MIPVFSDRRTDWPSHPYSSRDSLHEHDMWAAEGLTHRYPTKVLAELLPTCPQYCGHCTRMDLVGNSTPTVDKLKFLGKPVDRHAEMLDYLRTHPGVRDVVVSGGDVANMPWARLEEFLTKLLEIENIRDIRLATKALMGLPQHWLQDEVVEGMSRVAGTARARGVGLAIHTHVNHANSVTPLVAKATQAMFDAGVRDVRNQGVILNGVNADPHALLDLCFRLLDGAQILPYYFYMCDMIPNAEHWRISVADAQRLQHHIMGYLPGFATPRIVCDVPFVGKRWVHQISSYDEVKGISYWTKNYRTSIEASRPRGADPHLRVLRPDPHAAGRGPGVVGPPGAGDRALGLSGPACLRWQGMDLPTPDRAPARGRHARHRAARPAARRVRRRSPCADLVVDPVADARRPFRVAHGPVSLGRRPARRTPLAAVVQRQGAGVQDGRRPTRRARPGPRRRQAIQVHRRAVRRAAHRHRQRARRDPLLASAGRSSSSPAVAPSTYA